MTNRARSSWPVSILSVSLSLALLTSTTIAGPLNAVANNADELKVLGDAVEQLDELDNLRGLNTLDDLDYPRTLDNLNLNQALPDNIGKIPELNGAGQLDDAVNALPGAGDYGKIPDFNAAPDNGYVKLKSLDDAPAVNLVPDNTNKLPSSPTEYGKAPDFQNQRPKGNIYDTVPQQTNKLPTSPTEYGKAPDFKNQKPLTNGYDAVPQQTNQLPTSPTDYGAVLDGNAPQNPYGKAYDPDYIRLPPPDGEIGLNGYTLPGKPAFSDYDFVRPEELAQMYPPGGINVPEEALFTKGQKLFLGGATVFIVAGTGVGTAMLVKALDKKK